MTEIDWRLPWMNKYLSKCWIWFFTLSSPSHMNDLCHFFEQKSTHKLVFNIILFLQISSSKKCLLETPKKWVCKKDRVRKLYLPKLNFTKVHKRKKTGKKLLPNNRTYVIKLARLYWRGGFWQCLLIARFRWSHR